MPSKSIIRLYKLSDGRSLLIRPYKQGDEEQILGLFKLAFGHNKDPKQWWWEFRENPRGSRIMLAFLNSKLVAQCAGIPVKLFYKGKLIGGAQLVDCMSHPGFRGIAVKKKGIFALTVEAFFDAFTGCDGDMYLYGFPGYRHYKLGSLILKYRKTHPVVEAVIPVKTKKRRDRSIRIQMVDKREVEATLSGISGVITKHVYPSDFFVFKDLDYFRWRYLLIPHRSYSFAIVRSLLGTIKALVVMDTLNETCRIIDFFGNYPLIKVLPEIASFLGKNLTMWFPYREDFVEQLNGAGAIFREPSLKVIAVGRSFCEERLPWDEANHRFFYVMGDTDLF